MKHSRAVPDDRAMDLSQLAREHSGDQWFAGGRVYRGEDEEVGWGEKGSKEKERLLRRK